MGQNPYDFYRAYAAALRHVIKARFQSKPAANRQLGHGSSIVALCRDALNLLRSPARVDTAVIDPCHVTELARHTPGVRHVSRVRLHGSPTEAWVDLVIQVNPTLNTAQAHAIAQEIEQRIMTEMPAVVEVLVHIEPAPIERPLWKRVAQTVRLLADTARIGIHHLHVHKEPDGSLTVTLHAEVSADLTLAEAHNIVDGFEAKLRLLLPEVGAIVTHIDPVVTALEFESGTIRHEDEIRNQIARCIEQIAGIESCHSITFHQIGRKIMATVVVTQPPDQSVRESQHLAEAIRSAVLAQHRQISEVLVHIEPALHTCPRQR